VEETMGTPVVLSVEDVSEKFDFALGLTRLAVCFHDEEEDVFFGAIIAVSDELCADPDFDIGAWLVAWAKRGHKHYEVGR
jgi:hypothetical protein